MLLLLLAACAAVMLIAPAAEAAQVYPNWIIEPDNQTTYTPASGVVLFDVKGAPNATYTSAKTDPAGTTSLDSAAVVSAGTPWAKAFGTTAGHTYFEVLSHGPGQSSTATFTFLQQIEPGGWGFTLGDIDVDQVQITATSDGTRQLSGAQLTGNRVVRGSLSGNQVQGYVASVPYNYLGNGGPRPAWVPGAVGGQLIGNGLESDGAAGWFMPSTSVKTLTFTFTPLPGQTDPAAPQSYQLWFALRTHVVSGTVRNADTSLPVAGATLALSDPTGAVLGTVQSDQRGRYRIGNIYERSGYTLTIDPPGNLHVVGLDARSVDLSFGDKRIDFALTRNPNEPKPVPNPTPAQVKPQLTLAFAAKEVASETTTTLTATYRNRPAALGAASVSFTLPAGLSLRGSTCARVDGGVVTIDIANLQPMARSCAMTVGAARPVRTTATVDATLAVEVAPLAAAEDSASVVILPAGNAPRPVTG